MNLDAIVQENPITPLSNRTAPQMIEKQNSKQPQMVAVGSGLVTYKTSVTVSTQEGRLKRLKRGVITSSRLLVEDMQFTKARYKTAMLTLTYRPDADWNPRQVTSLIRIIREHLHRRGVKFRYVWVLELTKKGKPHYHLMLWLPKGITLPKPDKRGWWKHGMTRIEWVRNPVGYLAKYVSKGTEQYQMPRGARLYGTGGLSLVSRHQKTWWFCPSWIRDKCTWEDRPQKVPGGGYILRSTGEWFESPWLLIGRSNDWQFLQFAKKEDINNEHV
jgi:hypothetical protein